MSTTTLAYFEEITAEVEEKLGYTFRNRDILWEALQAPNSIGSGVPGLDLTDGNKRLALVGDAALKLVLLKRWYREGGSRGEACEVMSQVGSNVNLDRVGRKNGLHRYVNVNRPHKGPNFVSSPLMTSTVGAILGAVYLDGGVEMVEHVMITLELGVYDPRPY